MAIDFDSLDPSALTLYSTNQEPNDHFVEVYDQDASLVESLRTYISMGLNEGAPAIVVATLAHREALEIELAKTVDLRAAREQGLYVALDAEETLNRFVFDGVIDPAKFDEVVGATLAEAASKGEVRIFGEMVALLWGQGNVVATLVLEDLWNQLARLHSFRLFCAYPSDAFDDEDLWRFAAVCDRHSHVLVTKDKTV